MSDIEQKIIVLMQGIRPEDAYRVPDTLIDKRLLWNTLCRHIEQLEAFNKERYYSGNAKAVHVRNM